MKTALAKDTGTLTQQSQHFNARIVEIDEDAGQRIDNFLVKNLKNVPTSRVYKMVRKGEVRVNGGRIKPTYRLKSGDKVRIPPHRAGAPQTQAFIADSQQQRLNDAIIYEDSKLLVINKPAGLAVHGGSGVSYGVIEALRQSRPEQTLELVHRIDRDTSGCLLISKKRSALVYLHQLLREGQISKQYSLLVHGQWPKEWSSVRLPLQRFLTASGERRVRVDAAGKPCRTDFSVESRGNCATMLRAQLHTGRTHQIRVHTFATGHGVVGDQKYAEPQLQRLCEVRGVRRLCLHAQQISFNWEGRELSLESPQPDDILAAWHNINQAG